VPVRGPAAGRKADREREERGQTHRATPDPCPLPLVHCANSNVGSITKKLYEISGGTVSDRLPEVVIVNLDEGAPTG